MSKAVVTAEKTTACIDSYPYSLTITHMKTTIELPEELFQAAKLTAAQRRITLKTLFTQALRKEIAPPAKGPSGLIHVTEDGMPYLAKRGKTVTSAAIDQLDEETSA